MRVHSGAESSMLDSVRCCETVLTGTVGTGQTKITIEQKTFPKNMKWSWELYAFPIFQSKKSQTRCIQSRDCSRKVKEFFECQLYKMKQCQKFIVDNKKVRLQKWIAPMKQAADDQLAEDISNFSV